MIEVYDLTQIALATAPSTVTATTIVSSLLTVQTQARASPTSPPRSRNLCVTRDAREGAVTLFIRHTSASLTIQENADPSVLEDLTTALDAARARERRMAPRHRRPRRHAGAYQDHADRDVAARSRSLDGELALGTWQAIYLIEHRARPHRREIVLQFIGSVT